jgi:hypothetical protein
MRIAWGGKAGRQAGGGRGRSDLRLAQWTRRVKPQISQLAVPVEGSIVR